eukprot:58579-Chlamydomonas_euryale.AAC.1
MPYTAAAQRIGCMGNCGAPTAGSKICDTKSSYLPPSVTCLRPACCPGKRESKRRTKKRTKNEEANEERRSDQRSKRREQHHPSRTIFAAPKPLGAHADDDHTRQMCIPAEHDLPPPSTTPQREHGAHQLPARSDPRDASTFFGAHLDDGRDHERLLRHHVVGREQRVRLHVCQLSRLGLRRGGGGNREGKVCGREQRVRFMCASSAGWACEGEGGGRGKAKVCGWERKRAT